MTSHGFARPNLLGRLYLQLDSADVAAQIYYVLELADRIDPAALRMALAGVLDDVPQLRSRIVRHWYGYRRCVVPPADADLDRAFAVSSDAGATDAFFQHHPDLNAELPIQVLLYQGPAHDRLVIAMHHSLADGQALMFVLERLGERYECAVTDRPASSLGSRPGREARYRHLLQSLSWSDRWSVFQQAVRYLWDGAGLPGSATRAAFATFIDQPLPARGQLRYVRVGISVDQVTYLMRWAVKRRGSPSDVLLTASIRAALRVWPAQAALPILVSLPVSLRSAADVDVTNRVGVVDFQVRAGDFDAVFAQVAQATAEARTRKPAVIGMFKFAAASYLPPSVFVHVARGYLHQTTNVRESLTFTALGGAFDGGPQHFGPLAVVDSVFLGSVMAPPGLKIHVSPHGGRLNLGVAYLVPVIAPASIAAFADAIRMELDELLLSSSP